MLRTYGYSARHYRDRLVRLWVIDLCSFELEDDIEERYVRLIFDGEDVFFVSCSIYQKGWWCWNFRVAPLGALRDTLMRKTGWSKVKRSTIRTKRKLSIIPSTHQVHHRYVRPSYIGTTSKCHICRWLTCSSRYPTSSPTVLSQSHTCQYKIPPEQESRNLPAVEWQSRHHLPPWGLAGWARRWKALCW